MAILNKFLPKTHFNLLNMGSTKGVFYLKMVLFAGFFLASVSRLWLTLFGFVNRVFLRYNKNENIFQEKNQICFNPIEVAYSENFKRGDTEYAGFGRGKSDCSSIGSQENNETDSNHTEPEAEFKVEYSENFGRMEGRHDEFDEIESETPKFEFKFRFPTYEEISRSNKGNGGDSFSLDNTSPSTSTNKYEFLSGKSFSHFLEETEASSFTVKEFYAISDDTLIGNNATHGRSFLSEGDSLSIQQNSVEEAVHDEISENSEESEWLEATTSSKDAHYEKEQLGESQNNSSGEENVSGEHDFLSEKDFMASDFDLDSIVSSSVMDQLVDLSSDGFLSEKDFEGTSDGGNVEDLDLNSGYEPEDFDGEDSDILEELRKLEESDMKNSDTLNSEKRGEDVSHDTGNSKDEELVGKDEKSVDGKPNSKNSSEWDAEDSNGLETLWEHQDLIEQLKMELKKVKATGLPTILEESECPKIIEDLKPWKIDEKFQYGDRMSELHKFYKSYRERMRKFDILNYQKMYAIGFLESKDPLQSFSSHKSSAPAIKSILSQSFWLSKRKKSELDPMTKFITELHSDLEVVYVGQLCLSWEILHWQYEKALELWESDPYGLLPYNEVAGEFQQFQVLLQRFIENEPFQGPRVENYVKNRCVNRNFLQVPVIRADKGKEKKGRDDGAITIDKLIENLEGSMRTIWKFIHADKDACTTILTCRKEAHVELQNPSDSVLLMELRTDVQKKEKKLKDIFRSGNCILKRLQKHQEDGIDHHYFFSQVDMKLVSRVLNMSRIATDQLVWCHSKLSQVSFVNRKMHVEPSFLLFPC